MNDYDKSTFNKMIEEVQCTIQFHVDDLKLSCVHQEVLDSIIDELNEVFGQDRPKILATYRSVHDYLGMTID